MSFPPPQVSPVFLAEKGPGAAPPWLRASCHPPPPPAAGRSVAPLCSGICADPRLGCPAWCGPRSPAPSRRQGEGKTQRPLKVCACWGVGGHQLTQELTLSPEKLCKELGLFLLKWEPQEG